MRQKQFDSKHLGFWFPGLARRVEEGENDGRTPTPGERSPDSRSSPGLDEKG
jgi:hypothetical protein